MRQRALCRVHGRAQRDLANASSHQLWVVGGYQAASNRDVRPRFNAIGSRDRLTVQVPRVLLGLNVLLVVFESGRVRLQVELGVFTAVQAIDGISLSGEASLGRESHVANLRNQLLSLALIFFKRRSYEEAVQSCTSPIVLVNRLTRLRTLP